MDEEDLIVQYILLRTDMASMTKGRAAAQAAHAANSMAWRSSVEKEDGLGWHALVVEWENQVKDQGFGTTIVLNGVDEQTIIETVKPAIIKGFPAGCVVDPEYGVKDGEFVHIIPDVLTAGFILGRKSEVGPMVEHLELF